MRLLVIGGGGREHALIWKLTASPRVTKIYAIPGNGGISALAECRPDLPVDENLIKWASDNAIDLVVIGPEVPLVSGMADKFEAAGLRVFGPSAAAAGLEGSKSLAKDIMKEAGVPTGAAEVFNDYEQALDHIKGESPPYVIKADGLAAGKGVMIAEDIDSARRALKDCLIDKRFGQAGLQVIIEEFLEGPEVSVLAFTDGKAIKVMPAAQDYKRIGDNNTGPNTGGMGAYSPVSLLDKAGCEQVAGDIIKPTIEAMKARGVTYKGIIYAGLVLTENGLKVLEFNVRFGDPETQVLMPLLESDLVEAMVACSEGRLGDVEISWSTQKTLTVVMASEGYPLSPVVGQEITGLKAASGLGAVIFHAGTKLQDGRLLTDGGRVLDVTVTADSFDKARSKAYEAVDLIKFNGQQYRRDIGKSIN